MSSIGEGNYPLMNDNDVEWAYGNQWSHDKGSGDKEAKLIQWPGHGSQTRRGIPAMAAPAQKKAGCRDRKEVHGGGGNLHNGGKTTSPGCEA